MDDGLSARLTRSLRSRICVVSPAAIADDAEMSEARAVLSASEDVSAAKRSIVRAPLSLSKSKKMMLIPRIITVCSYCCCCNTIEDEL